MLCGTAYHNKGVQPLLDAVIDYLPNPLDIGEVAGHAVNDESQVVVRKPSVDDPFAALAFKIAVHPFFGKLTFVRVYSGLVEPGAQVTKLTKAKKERIGQDVPDARQQGKPGDRGPSLATSTPSSV